MEQKCDPVSEPTLTKYSPGDSMKQNAPAESVFADFSGFSDFSAEGCGPKYTSKERALIATSVEDTMTRPHMEYLQIAIL